MPTIPPPFVAVRLLARTALAVAIGVSAAATGYGLARWAAGQGWDFGLIGGGLLALALATLLYVLIHLAHRAAGNSYRAYDALLDIAEMLRRQTDYTRAISENSSLSDWAKRIVYREKDYEYLRETIQGDIARQDWPSAERLIRELDEKFDLRDEAAGLRSELEQARRATGAEKLAAAVRHFEALCDGQKWDQARRAAESLRQLFPADARISNLPHELEVRRGEFKRQLLKEYEEAVRLQNVDVAHRILYTLDHYLSPNEAAALKESARGVFKAKLQQLGVQFTLAVTDKQFRRAIEIGERLVREFPNSRYAQEILGLFPVLRQRAAQEPG